VFIESVKKVATLVKKGGYFIADSDGSESFSVADTTFYTPLNASNDDIYEAYSKADLSILKSTTFVSFDKTTLTIAHKKIIFPLCSMYKYK